MRVDLVTLCSGDYHLGVGVLLNSFIRNGFEGAAWVGYRGAVPPWAAPLSPGPLGSHEYRPTPASIVRFVPMDGEDHLTWRKPSFLLRLMDAEPATACWVYIDPDIVNRAPWSFYDHWLRLGVALCVDLWDDVAPDHPRRRAWEAFAREHDRPPVRSLWRHYNAGFVGVPTSGRRLIEVWQELIDLGAREGLINLNEPYDQRYFWTFPYLYGDQTLLNLALALTDVPLTTMGQEAMDFVPGGANLSHATVPAIKPWRKRLLVRALTGDPPSPTDKHFWAYASEPIPVFPASRSRRSRAEIKLGSALGRIIRRPPF